MKFKKIIIKLDIPGSVKQINAMSTEDQLFSFSRKLRMYYDQGLIVVPYTIREAMNNKLDEIYRRQ